VRLVFTSLLLCALALPAVAENSTRSGEYTIHHNAFKSDFLDPKVAQAYGLQRSKFRGIINISVVQEKAGTTGIPVAANIKVKALNLMGVPKTIKLRGVREQDAIYYIDDFPIVDGEIVNFELEVTPAGSKQRIRAKFHQQFYVE
jgi:hypothetical protein